MDILWIYYSIIIVPYIRFYIILLLLYKLYVSYKYFSKDSVTDQIWSKSENDKSHRLYIITGVIRSNLTIVDFIWNYKENILEASMFTYGYIICI